MMNALHCAAVLSIFYFTGANTLNKETELATDGVEESLRVGSSVSSAPSSNSLLKIKNILQHIKAENKITKAI